MLTVVSTGFCVSYLGSWCIVVHLLQLLDKVIVSLTNKHSKEKKDRQERAESKED